MSEWCWYVNERNSIGKKISYCVFFFQNITGNYESEQKTKKYNTSNLHCFNAQISRCNSWTVKVKLVLAKVSTLLKHVIKQVIGGRQCAILHPAVASTMKHHFLECSLLVGTRVANISHHISNASVSKPTVLVTFYWISARICSHVSPGTVQIASPQKRVKHMMPCRVAKTPKQLCGMMHSWS